MKLKFTKVITYIIVALSTSSAFSGKMRTEHETVKHDIEKIFNPRETGSEARPSGMNLEDWKTLCSYVNTCVDQVDPIKYSEFKDLLRNTLVGVQNIKYGDEDFGSAVLQKLSRLILSDFMGAVGLELEEYLHKSSFIDQVNLGSTLSNTDCTYAITHIQELIKQCENDTKALLLLKEKVTEFCKNTEKFTKEEKDLMMQLTHTIQDVSHSKENIEPDEIENILLEIETLCKKNKTLEQDIELQEITLEDLAKKREEELQNLILLSELNAAGELNASDFKTKEDQITEEIIALDLRLDTIKNAITLNKDENKNNNEQISHFKNTHKEFLKKAQEKKLQYHTLF